MSNVSLEESEILKELKAHRVEVNEIKKKKRDKGQKTLNRDTLHIKHSLATHFTKGNLENVLIIGPVGGTGHYHCKCPGNEEQSLGVRQWGGSAWETNTS